MNPADLRRWAVALLVLSGYAEDNGRAVGGGAVDVSVVQLGCADRAGHLGATVDPDEVHLTQTLQAGGAALLHRHVHGILQDATRWRGGSLPRDVDQIIGLRTNKRVFGEHGEAALLN